MGARVMHRSIAILCALSVLVVLGFLAPTAHAVTRAAADQPVKITPGAIMVTSLGSEAVSTCTAAFVFRNDRSTFLSYAAHCAIPVQEQRRTGCEYRTLPLGTPVTIRGAAGARAHGTLAYSAWRTMQDAGETDDNRCLYNDFALVEIDSADVASIDPTVPEVGGPTGLGRIGPPRQEQVFSYQPYTSSPAVKQGVSLGTRGGGWSHRVDVSPAANLGDSGSGLLDAEGAAFGVLATRYLDRLATSGVTDLGLALSYAERYGDLGSVELVPGTSPFELPDPPADETGSRTPAG